MHTVNVEAEGFKEDIRPIKTVLKIEVQPRFLQTVFVWHEPTAGAFIAFRFHFSVTSKERIAEVLECYLIDVHAKGGEMNGRNSYLAAKLFL